MLLNRKYNVSKEHLLVIFISFYFFSMVVFKNNYTNMEND